MHYSYEFKLECVHLYKETGTYPPTPEKVKQHSFRYKISEWVRMYDKHGPDIKSLLLLSEVFSVSLDQFVKEKR